MRIYIVLTYTGTALSKIIKSYTKAEFSHVSISLDEELNKMYSFGRLTPYNPFIGGMLHEKITEGTFKRFKKTKASIYSLNITMEQYKKIEETISYMYSNKQNYNFNVYGLFAAGFNKKITKPNTFYCAEFVKYLLDCAKIDLNLPEVVKPEDFKSLEKLKLIYKGKLRKYTTKHRYTLQDIIRVAQQKEATM